MNTPGKEALDAACDLFKHRYCYGSDNDNAAIIDRHFEPLRQRSEQAEARVKELEFGLKHQCETCEMKSIFDGEHDLAVKAQTRVKELEAENENAAEAYKLLSRRLFYAEQDKRQSAEQRNAELEAALRETLDDPNSTISGALYYRMEQVLARAESATPDHIRNAAQMVSPAKHPDTELIDRFEEMCGSLEYCDADEVRNHWRAYGYSGSNEGVGRTMRDALRATIAARKEVQP